MVLPLDLIFHPKWNFVTAACTFVIDTNARDDDMQIENVQTHVIILMSLFAAAKKAAF